MKRLSIKTLENKRFSILTEDLDHCIICGRKKDNLHEVFFGKNRVNSMLYGCVIPLCYEHHLEIHKNSVLDDIYKDKMQRQFEKTYPDKNFLKIFYKNYKREC